MSSNEKREYEKEIRSIITSSDISNFLYIIVNNPDEEVKNIINASSFNECNWGEFNDYRVMPSQNVIIHSNQSIEKKEKCTIPADVGGDNFIIPVYLYWPKEYSQKEDSHLCYLVKKGGKLWRLESHGQREDCNSEMISHLTHNAELYNCNDVQLLSVPMCRLAATYALIAFVCEWKCEGEERGFKTLSVDNYIELNQMIKEVCSLKPNITIPREKSSRKCNEQNKRARYN